MSQIRGRLTIDLNKLYEFRRRIQILQVFLDAIKVLRIYRFHHPFTIYKDNHRAVFNDSCNGQCVSKQICLWFLGSNRTG